MILKEIEKYHIIRDPLQFELSQEEIEYLKNLEKEIPFKVDHLSEKDWKIFSELFTYHTRHITQFTPFCHPSLQHGGSIH